MLVLYVVRSMGLLMGLGDWRSLDGFCNWIEIYKYEIWVTSLLLFVYFVVALVISFFTYFDFIYFALDFYSLRKLAVAFNNVF
jgi:hypothetical protein